MTVGTTETSPFPTLLLAAPSQSSISMLPRAESAFAYTTLPLTMSFSRRHTMAHGMMEVSSNPAFLAPRLLLLFGMGPRSEYTSRMALRTQLSPSGATAMAGSRVDQLFHQLLE